MPSHQAVTMMQPRRTAEPQAAQAYPPLELGLLRRPVLQPGHQAVEVAGAGAQRNQVLQLVVCAREAGGRKGGTWDAKQSSHTGRGQLR
jgi:hypothetical protein